MRLRQRRLSALLAWGLVGGLAACQALPPTLDAPSGASLADPTAPEGASLRVKLPNMPSAPNALALAKGEASAPTARRLSSTPTYVARIVLTLLQAGQEPRVVHINRWWAGRTNPEVAFNGVPAGNATLRAEAFDWAGNRLGESEQAIALGAGQQQQIQLNIPIAGLPSHQADATELESTIVQSNSRRGSLLMQSALGSADYRFAGSVSPDGQGGAFAYSAYCLPGQPLCGLYVGRESFLVHLPAANQPTLAAANNRMLYGSSIQSRMNPPVLSHATKLLAVPLSANLLDMNTRAVVFTDTPPPGARSYAFDDDGLLASGGKLSTQAPFARQNLAQVGNLVASRPGPGFWSVKSPSTLQRHDAAGDVVASSSLPSAPARILADGQSGLWVQLTNTTEILQNPRLLHLGADAEVLADFMATDQQAITVDTQGQLWSVGNDLRAHGPTGQVLESYPIKGAGLAPEGDTLWIRTDTGVMQMAL